MASAAALGCSIALTDGAPVRFDPPGARTRARARIRPLYPIFFYTMQPRVIKRDEEQRISEFYYEGNRTK